MSTIAKLLVALGLDASGYHKGLQDAEQDARQKSSGIGKALGGLAGLGAGILKTGAVAAGAAVTGLGVGLASTIGPASDLAETANKINVVFGDANGQINAFAANAAADLGQTKQAALDAAATFGVFGKSAGMSGSELAGFSTQLVGLSSDLASFYNTSPEQAIEAIGAALRGESEPIRQYGVLLDDATLKAKAFEMGIYDGTGALTPQQKVLAAQAEILAQTSDAQGDFARTSDGLANQQRILTAQLENTRATIGSALLPVITQLSQRLTEFLSSPAVQEGITKLTEGIAKFATTVLENLPVVVDWFKRAFGWLMENQGVIVAALAIIGASILAFVATSVVPAAIATISATWPILLVIAAIGAAAYLLYEAWQNNWGGIRDTVLAIWAEMQPYLERVRAWLEVVIPIAIEYLKKAWVALGPVVEAVFAVLGTILWVWWEIVKTVVDFVTGYINSLIWAVQTLKRGWDQDFMGIRTILTAAYNYIHDTFALIKAVINGDWEEANNIMVNAWDRSWGLILKKAREIGAQVIGGIVQGVIDNIKSIIETMTRVGQIILDTVRDVLGIASPSKLMADMVGAMLPPGIVLGAEEAMPAAMSDLQSMLLPPAPTVALAGAGNGQGAVGSGQVINFYYQPFLTTQDAEKAAYILDPILEIRDRRRTR